MALERVRPDAWLGGQQGEARWSPKRGADTARFTKPPSDRLASSGVPEGWGLLLAFGSETARRNARPINDALLVCVVQEIPGFISMV